MRSSNLTLPPSIEHFRSTDSYRRNALERSVLRGRECFELGGLRDPARTCRGEQRPRLVDERTRTRRIASGQQSRERETDRTALLGRNGFALQRQRTFALCECVACVAATFGDAAQPGERIRSAR